MIPDLPEATVVKGEEMTREEPETVEAAVNDELFPGIRAGGMYQSSPGVPITIIDMQTGDVVMKINSATRQITNASDRQAMTLGFNDHVWAGWLAMTFTNKRISVTISNGEEVAAGYITITNMGSFQDFNFRLEIHENCAHPAVAVLLMATFHKTFYQGVPGAMGAGNHKHGARHCH